MVPFHSLCSFLSKPTYSFCIFKKNYRVLVHSNFYRFLRNYANLFRYFILCRIFGIIELKKTLLRTFAYEYFPYAMRCTILRNFHCDFVIFYDSFGCDCDLRFFFKKNPRNPYKIRISGMHNVAF